MGSFVRKYILFLIFSLILIFESFSAFPQNQIQIKYSGNRGYTLVERTNLRRYINGKYSGLTSREVRSFISPVSSENFVSKKQNPMAAKAQWYDGNFYVQEETLRDSRKVGVQIHEAIPSVFYIDADGHMKMFEDNGYPSFRSFPSYTSQNLKPGDSWKAEAERAVDPMNKGVFTRMPIQVLYTFSGEESYKNEQVYRIKAIWQTNYGFSNFNLDVKGDESLIKALGGHKADIIVRKTTGEAILILDNVDEAFFYKDGTEINFKGTITQFTEYPPAVDRDKLFMNLQRVASVSQQKVPTASEMKSGTNIAKADGNSGKGSDGKSSKVGGGSAGSISTATKKSNDGNPSKSGSGKLNRRENRKSGKTSDGSPDKGNAGNDGFDKRRRGSSADGYNHHQETPKNNLVVEETSAGVRLSIRDIKFKADSADLLSGESSRLDNVAKALKTVPENQFLIEGHTASVGKPSGEQQLSVERAETIAKELIKRGIPADKFICKGWGGNKPVADNSTSAGRAQNRRVEITVLE